MIAYTRALYKRRQKLHHQKYTENKFVIKDLNILRLDDAGTRDGVEYPNLNTRSVGRGPENDEYNISMIQIN